MNFIKRAILSMKKNRNIINFDGGLSDCYKFSVGRICNPKCIKSCGCSKKKLGADVTLGLDFDKLGQQARETGEMPKPPKLNTKEADQLAKSKYVKIIIT